jgi:O-antigen ligase
VKNETRSKLVNYSYRAGLISLALLIALLSFHGITTLKEILFFMVLGTFILRKVLPDRNTVLKFTPVNKHLDFFIILSFIWAAVTVLYALDPHYSFNEVTRKMTKHYLLYFLAFSVVNDIQPDRNLLRRIFLPLVIAMLVMSVYACYQFSQYPLFFYNRVSGFTGRFYRLATFLVISLPIISVLPFYFRGRFRVLLLLPVPVSIIALFFTSVRAAWLAVVFETLLLTVLLLKKYRKSIFLGIVIISVLFSFAAYKSQSYKNLIIHGPRSEGARVEGVFRSLKIISEHPVTGIGYGKKTFSKYYPELTEPKHAHNIFLNTAVELGIPGLVFFVIIIGIILKTFVQALKRNMLGEDKLLFSGLFASIAGFLILNFFDYMYHGWPGMIFWAFVGIGHAMISQGAKSLSRRPS